MILFIELFSNLMRFGFLDFHQGVSLIKWIEKDKKNSISVGRAMFYQQEYVWKISYLFRFT